MLLADKSIEVLDWEPHFSSSGDNSVHTIKSSAGVLGMLRVANKNASDMWIQLYDESGTITVGTTTPVLSIMVSAGDGTLRGSAEMITPIRFQNSIKYACTTTPEGSTTPPVDLEVNAAYL